MEYSNEGLRKPKTHKGARLIIVNADGESGFVGNTYIPLNWKSTNKTGEYHNEIDYYNYKKWVKEKLIKKLSKESIVVIDNAPYHNKEIDKCPHSVTKKSRVQLWEKNIPFREDSLKPEFHA